MILIARDGQRAAQGGKARTKGRKAGRQEGTAGRQEGRKARAEGRKARPEGRNAGPEGRNAGPEGRNAGQEGTNRIPKRRRRPGLLLTALDFGCAPLNCCLPAFLPSASLCPRKRRQLGRARAVQRRAGDWHVRELDAVARVAEHQPAAAHVAAADEVDREQQPVAEDRRQHLTYFGEATLPSSTTSQSGPTSRRSVRALASSGAR